MTAGIFDPTPCALGEGPFWHPLRGELFWFDILKFRLYARGFDASRNWQFDEHVSAAGFIDEARLLIASETRLFTFDLDTGAAEDVALLEDDRGDTRSNDGRADPFGGFWIGTMSKSAEVGQGAIYRYYRGELRKLYPDMTIPNAICFSPGGELAYFADTRARKVWRQRLPDRDGWPSGDPEGWLDLSGAGLNPDGAVVDAGGRFWNAQWGAGRVAAYDPTGREVASVSFQALQTSCPAFGGPELGELYCTTARQGLSAEVLKDGSSHGATFVAPVAARGQPEHKVIL